MSPTNQPILPDVQRPPARWTPLAVGLACLLLVATLGKGGGSTESLFAWHGLLVALIAGVFLAGRAPREAAAGPLIAATLFLALAGLGALRAPYGYAALLTGLELAACLAVFCLAARVGPGLVQRLRWPVGAAAAAQAGLVLWQRFALGQPRPAGTFLNTNHLAGWLVLALLLVLCGRRREDSTAARALALAVAAVSCLAILVSGSRGALLGLGLALAWWIAARWRGLPRPARTAVLATAALLVMFVGVRQAQRLGEADPFRYQRLRIWKASARVLIDHPWWGTGPGQFSSGAAPYQFADGDGPLDHDRGFGITHSDLLRVPCEFGLPAAAALLAAAWLAAAAIARRRRRGELGAEHDGAVAALIAVSAQALVDNPSRWPALYLLVCALLGALLSGPRGGARSPRLRWPLRAALAAALVLLFLVADLAPTVAHRAFRLVPPVSAPPLGARQEGLLAVARALNPHHPAYLRRVAEERIRVGGELDLAAYAEAREAAETALRLQPRAAEYAWTLARVEAEACLRLFRDEATRERAVGNFELAQALAPMDSRVSVDAGGFLLSSGDPLGARRLAERALRIEPNAVPPRLLLAESLLDAGAPEATTRAGHLLAEAREIAERWSGAMPDGVYPREMLRFDARAASRIEEKLSAATPSEPARPL